MTQDQTTKMLEGVRVRSYKPEDQAAVSRLYTEGLLAGQIAPNDTGADIENIHEAYFDEDRHHFWVAETEKDGQVVGMIGVASDEPHTAEVRRLRVTPEHQDSPIAEHLLRTALQHCKHHGYLKVMLNTRFEHDAAVDLFDHIGFQHTRTRSHHGKDMLEFYLDLYRQAPEEQQGSHETE
ncbi:MAG: GNAT family N-acetyltransferase [Phycisphaeraceae bacterium]